MDRCLVGWINKERKKRIYLWTGKLRKRGKFMEPKKESWCCKEMLFFKMAFFSLFLLYPIIRYLINISPHHNEFHWIKSELSENVIVHTIIFIINFFMELKNKFALINSFYTKLIGKKMKEIGREGTRG